ncbi:hypothetical protein D3C76_1288130 [compost metagenome]
MAEKFGAPSISPSGCYRIETFKPFWVLPSMFQPEYDPNEDVAPRWFQVWGYPGFYRLYDHRSGELIGESNIYDLQYTSGPLLWGSKSIPEVSAGAIYIRRSRCRQAAPRSAGPLSFVSPNARFARERSLAAAATLTVFIRITCGDGDAGR